MNPMNQHLVRTLTTNTGHATGTSIVFEAPNGYAHFYLQGLPWAVIGRQITMPYFNFRDIIYNPRERLQEMLK